MHCPLDGKTIEDIGLEGEALEALTGLEEEKAIQFWVCHGVLLRTRYWYWYWYRHKVPMVAWK